MPSNTIGSTVTDGTVVWTVGGLFGAYLIPSYLDFNDYQMPGFYNVNRNTGKQNIPDGMNFGLMQVLSNGVSFDKAQFVISRNNSMHYRGYSAYGTWNPWLLNEAIVAYSINSNGYIKYASGLILQWGGNIGSSDTVLNIPLNINMTKIVGATAVYDNSDGRLGSDQTIEVQSIKQNSIKILRSSGLMYHGIQWFVIGY